MCAADVNIGLRMAPHDLKKEMESHGNTKNFSFLPSQGLLRKVDDQWFKIGICQSFSVASTDYDYGQNQGLQISCRAIILSEDIRATDIVTFSNFAKDKKFYVKEARYTRDISIPGPAFWDLVCCELIEKEPRTTKRKLDVFKTVNEVREAEGLPPVTVKKQIENDPEDINPIVDMWEEQIRGEPEPEEEIATPEPEEALVVAEKERFQFLTRIYQSKAFWPVVGFIGAILLLLFEYLYLAD